jgi:putative restriction endonuclease
MMRHEFERRTAMWHSLLDSGGPGNVSPSLLRKLGIYGGAQGIWINKERTSNLTESGTGVTVGLLHTGKAYADDLSTDGVLYHYPATNRPPGRDSSEIEATKAASAGEHLLKMRRGTEPIPRLVALAGRRRMSLTSAKVQH